MSQASDYTVDNSTGANVRIDLNAIFGAIATNNSAGSDNGSIQNLGFFADTSLQKLRLKEATGNNFVNLRGFDGSLPLPDGSASSPSLFFNDDTNTGIFSSAADTFNVATGGVERMELGTTTIFNESGADVDFRIEGDSEANLFYVDAGNDRIGIGTSSPDINLHVHTDSNNDGVLIKSTGNSSNSLNFDANRSGANAGIGSVRGKWNGTTVAQMSFVSGSDTTDKNDGFITFGTESAASNGNVNADEKMRIDSSGRLLIGRTSPVTSDTDFLDILAPQTTGHHSVHLAGHTSSTVTSGRVLKCDLHGFYRQSYGQTGFLFKNNDDTSHNRGVRVHLYQNNDSTTVGSIFFNTSSTDFNTSSDYRLKENEVLISDGITRIKQLKPYRFNFKNVPSVTVDGFFAHEVADVVPHAVGGEKDEMKPNAWYQEGDTIPSGKAVGDVKGYSDTEMEIQQLDYSKLVTVTVAALQEAITKIETLETKVAALEAA